MFGEDSTCNITRKIVIDNVVKVVKDFSCLGVNKDRILREGLFDKRQVYFVREMIGGSIFS